MFWSKTFAASDTNSLEQLPTDLKLANSLNDFRHKLKDHFFKKHRNMEQNTFAY